MIYLWLCYFNFFLQLYHRSSYYRQQTRIPKVPRQNIKEFILSKQIIIFLLSHSVIHLSKGVRNVLLYEKFSELDFTMRHGSSSYQAMNREELHFKLNIDNTRTPIFMSVFFFLCVTKDIPKCWHTYLGTLLYHVVIRFYLIWGNSKFQAVSLKKCEVKGWK